jgi:hypothetical protein
MPTQPSRRTKGRPGLEPLLAEFAAEPRPAEEFVHDLHRRLRHRRTEVRLAQRVGPASSRPRSARADQRLRLLERALGDLRNRQLAHGHLEGLAARSATPPVRAGLRRAARLLDAEVRERSVEARWLAQTSRRLLLPEAMGPATLPTGSAPLNGRWAREAGRRYRRYRKSLRTARKSGDAEDLHAARQQLRRMRVLEERRPGGAVASAAAFRRVDRTVSALGAVHDLDVLAQILRTLPTGPAGTVLLADLAERRAKALRRVVALLRSRRLQRFGRHR